MLSEMLPGMGSSPTFQSGHCVLRPLELSGYSKQSGLSKPHPLALVLLPPGPLGS